MWRSCEKDVSSTPRCTSRLHEHLLAHLICPGRHTISGLITTFGKQFRDWSADYALYAKDRVDEEVIFTQVRKEVEALAPESLPLRVALDDTILRKTGKTIPGAAWRKDPLSPPFNLNLVWAQRRIQLSAAVADENSEVRMIPIRFLDASTPRKPAKTALPEQVEIYRENMKQRNLNTLASQALHRLQQERAGENGGTAPALRVVVDGSYTNRKILRHLPENTTLIGRIRKDAKLSAKPETQAARGRKRIYGSDLPTPEQIRQDPDIPWVTVRVRASGKWRDFEVKTLSPVRWRAAGEMDLRLMIIRPSGYRLRKGARRLYTKPAYLICTDPDLPLQDVLQEYVWRWDIEVNHRDEKTVVGVGQAQVRNKNSVENIPAMAVAAYAMLHVAAIKAYGSGGKPAVIPEAKWRKPGKKKGRPPRISSTNCAGNYGRQPYARRFYPTS